MHIIPAILPKTQQDLQEHLQRLVDARFSGWVQIDICDGVFVQNTTSFTSIPKIPDFLYELDLMVMIPDLATLTSHIEHQPDRIILHYESLFDPVACIAYVRSHDISVFIACNNETPIQSIRESLTIADGVQCMGIATIGFQGQPFDERVFENIAFIREQYPTLPISIDGGVSISTLPRLVEQGVSSAVAGSAVFGGNVAENLEKLQSVLY
jgi:ribulose-phosphate 3-epimerase